DRFGVVAQVGDRDVAVGEHEVEVGVAVEVDPGVAPAGERRRGHEVVPGVGVALPGRLAPVHGVALAPRVRDEQVGVAVAVVVGGGDPHAGVGVVGAGVLGHVPQAEAEAVGIGGGASRPGLVP